MNRQFQLTALFLSATLLFLSNEGYSRDSTSVTGYEKVNIISSYKRLRPKTGSGIMFMNAKLFSYDDRISEFYGECENMATGEKLVCFYNTQIQLNNSLTRKVNMGDRTMYRRQLVNAYRMPEGKYRVNKITIRKSIGTRQRGRYTDTVSSHEDVDLGQYGLIFDVTSKGATYLGRLAFIVEPDQFYVESLNKLEARDRLRKDLALIKKPKLIATLGKLLDDQQSAFSLRNINIEEQVDGPGTWRKLSLSDQSYNDICLENKSRVMRKSNVTIGGGVFKMTLTKDGFPAFSSDRFTEKMKCGLYTHMRSQGLTEFRQLNDVSTTRKQGARGKIVPTSYSFGVEFR